MLLLAWKTFLHRWQVFIGAIVTVCLGVALVQSSLLIVVAAATVPTPPGLSESDLLTFRYAYDGILILISMVLALATFVAVFIVSSTFSFAVSQRRGELALLRLTGAGREQIRSLLAGEALLLGLVGSALGVVLGLPVMRLQMWILDDLEFAPPGFEVQWHSWVIPVSLGAGVLIAVLGVLAASRRASQVRPLEALRESGLSARVMTASRWALGTLFTAGGVALFLIFPAGSAGLPAWFIQLTPFLVSVPLVVGFAALAPLVVPLVSRLLGLAFRGQLAELALANLRFDAQRSASTATPIMVLFAFVASIGGTLGTVSEGARQEMLHTLEGDLLVTTDQPAVSELAGVDGVELVSAETGILFDLRSGDQYGEVWYEAHDGLAVDPTTYDKTRDVEVAAGDLLDLTGATVAVSLRVDSAGDWRVGDTLQIRLDGEGHEVRIVALLPASVSGPSFLLPYEATPSAAGPWQHIVQLAIDADEDAVAVQLGELGTVETIDQWVRAAADVEERQTLDIMIVLLGMTMTYTAVAMVNAVVISASARRREFAVARVTGLRRGQVVKVALGESQAVVIVGLFLGAAAAAGSIVGASVAIRNLTGITVVAIPWPLLGVLALGAAVVVGVTSVLTTVSATRTPPVRLVAARE